MRGKSISAGSSLPVRELVKRILCLLLLGTVLVMTFITAGRVSEVLLDSDASSNMILGEKLAREGGIFSKTFRYATELFVVDAQIVYSLLFRLTGDWSLVRMWGAFLMQVLMLAAYGLLARQSRMSFNLFCITGAALLLPFSVPYGRIVLFHNYYTPIVTLDFLAVGLFLGARRSMAEHALWWKTALWGGFMALTAFAMGLAGVRQLMICAAPAAVAAVLCAAWGEEGENRLRQELPSLIWAGVLAVSMALGYLVNSRVLSGIYHFVSYDTQTLVLADAEKREMIFENLLTALGFEGNLELFTLQGLLSVGSVAAGLIALALSVMTFLRTRDPEARYISGFFLADLVVITCVFLFLGSQEFLFTLYYLPVIVWMLPVLGRADARKAEPESWVPWRLSGGEGRKLCARQVPALLACGLLLANGVFYTGFFRDPKASDGGIAYTGLNVEITDTVEMLRPVADYMKEQGYTLCYASYWDGAVITELTDGAVRTVPVEATGRKKPLRYFEWMADANLWDPGWASAQKACILADFENLGSYMEDIAEKVEGLEERDSIGGYTVWELTDPGAVARLIGAPKE